MSRSQKTTSPVSCGTELEPTIGANMEMIPIRLHGKRNRSDVSGDVRVRPRPHPPPVPARRDILQVWYGGRFEDATSYDAIDCTRQIRDSASTSPTSYEQMNRFCQFVLPCHLASSHSR